MKIINSLAIIVMFISVTAISVAGDPIPGIDVRIESSKGEHHFSAKTGQNGVAVFSELVPGDYTVKVSRVVLKDFFQNPSTKGISTSRSNIRTRSSSVTASDEQANFQVTLSSEALKGKNIRKNITVNLRSSSTNSGITAMDDWESPVTIVTPPGNGGGGGGGSSTGSSLEVRVEKIEMK